MIKELCARQDHMINEEVLNNIDDKKSVINITTGRQRN